MFPNLSPNADEQTPGPGASSETPVTSPSSEPAAPAATPAPVADQAAAPPVVTTPDDVSSLRQQHDALQRELSTRVSGFQTAINRLQQEREAERRQWQERLQSIETADMDENERAVYERNLLQQEAAQLRQQMDEYRQQTAYYVGMQQWADYFTQQGVPRERLDMGSFETLQASAWAYAREALERGAQAPAPAAMRAQAPAAAGTNPPAVASATPGAPPPQRRWADIPYAEQQRIIQEFEQGRIRPDQLPV